LRQEHFDVVGGSTVWARSKSFRKCRTIRR
jgi:hypothetical protein